MRSDAGLAGSGRHTISPSTCQFEGARIRKASPPRCCGLSMMLTERNVNAGGAAAFCAGGGGVAGFAEGAAGVGCEGAGFPCEAVCAEPPHPRVHTKTLTAVKILTCTS